jgi:hypothetical protein
VHVNPEAGLELLAKAADVARGLPDKRAFMLALRFWALHAPDLGAARSTLEEVVSVARGVGDQRELAFALSLLGTFDESRGDVATAEQRYAEAVAAARTARDSIAIADALLRLGGLATTQASYTRSGASRLEVS